MKYIVRGDVQLSVVGNNHILRWSVWAPRCDEGCDHYRYMTGAENLCNVGTSQAKSIEESIVLNRIFRKILVYGFERQGIELVGPLGSVDLLPAEVAKLTEFNSLREREWEVREALQAIEEKRQSLGASIESGYFRQEEAEEFVTDVDIVRAYPRSNVETWIAVLNCSVVAKASSYEELRSQLSAMQCPMALVAGIPPAVVTGP